jgi:hypothetical protein
VSSRYIILAGGHIRVYIVGFTMMKSLSCQLLAIDKICFALSMMAAARSFRVAMRVGFSQV